MVTKSEHKTWTLEDFLDSFILELDKVQDTLSVKGVTRPLNYTVRDVALELQLFPQFDGDSVRFINAQPGDSGASRVSIQLGSITDRQIRETTKPPIGKDDVDIDLVETIDPETKKSLKKMGVSSLKDIERMEKKNVDLEKASKKKVDYGKLASLIQQSRRRDKSPKVDDVSLSKSEGRVVMTVRGSGLALMQGTDEFPIAALNDEPVDVLSATDREMTLSVTREQFLAGANELKVALDPYSVIRMKLKS